MEYAEFRAMNTEIVVAAQGDPDAVRQGFAAAQHFVEQNEARLTRFSDSSELAQLNRSAGRPFAASPELFDVVRQAVEYNAKTGGLFDPTILDALEAAGYDRSMDDIRAHGAGQPRQFTSTRWACQDIRCEESTNTVLLPPGVRLDLGGIAKGWIAQGAARVLAEFTGACAVNAGGDMVTVGLPEGEEDWQVALEDPLNADQTLAILRVGPGAVATSSITRRRWLQGDRWQHHMIDPRRGIPAETDWLSVTAIAPQATEAEVFAKAVLIAGSREGRTLAAGRPDLTFIAVDANGQLWGTAKARSYTGGGNAGV